MNQSEESPSFADPGGAVSSGVSDPVHVNGTGTQPVRERQWVDGQGDHWRMCGRQIEAHAGAVRRLLERPGLRVLHADGSTPREVFGRQHEALLERVRRSVISGAEPPSDFSLAEFRTEDGRILLVLEETCSRR